MLYLKTPPQINGIREAGALSAKILRQALEMADQGVTELDLDQFIDAEITKAGAKAWFKDEKDYNHASCISVNEVWIHGMPTDNKLKYGDIIKIDMGINLGGYFSDHCWTIPVVPKNERPSNIFDLFTSPSVSADILKFLEAGQTSIKNAINAAQAGKRTGDISYEMQNGARSAGFDVIQEYIGHGVGLSGHEEPEIPCYGSRGAGVLLKKGMVLAIEIMYCMGNPDIDTKEDGWSVVSKDEKLTGMFEHTVAITENGPEILTI